MIESENGVAQIEDWTIPLTEKKTFESHCKERDSTVSFERRIN